MIIRTGNISGMEYVIEKIEIMPRKPAILIFASAFILISIRVSAQPMDYPSGDEQNAPLSWEMYRQQQVQTQIENQRQLIELRRRQLEMQQQQLELQRQQLEIQRRQQQLEFERQAIDRKK